MDPEHHLCKADSQGFTNERTAIVTLTGGENTTAQQKRSGVDEDYVVTRD